MTKRSKRFKVTGAGEIEITKSASALTGDKVGFGFSVSWGIYGHVGGVLSREEARALANHILISLSNCNESEKEVIKRFRNRP